MKKKGLSPVVATIAIILLTLGAVTFIAGFLVPYVKTQLNEGTECIDYREYFTFDDSFGFNCYEQSGANYLTGLSVRAKSSSDRVSQGVGGFNLVFYEGAGTNRIKVENGGLSGNLVGEIKMWNDTRALEIPEEGGVRTYVYNSSLKVSRVEILPFLKSNGRICEASDDIDVICNQEGLS